MKVPYPVKYPTPYGGRLIWTLPGGTKIICHLKDKTSGQFYTGNDSFPWYPSNLNWIKRSVFFLYARKNNDDENEIP